MEESIETYKDCVSDYKKTYSILYNKGKVIICLELQRGQEN